MVYWAYLLLLHLYVLQVSKNQADDVPLSCTAGLSGLSYCIR